MSTQIGVREAAELLGISQQRVRTLCRLGTLPAKMVGNAWVVEREAVDLYGLQTAHMVAEDHPTYQPVSSAQRRPIALSFFSGAMGLDLGIEKTGFRVLLACEVDKYCRQTIAINRPATALLSDISTYSKGDVLEAAGLTEDDDIDLVIGGPPCQAFSTAGKRKAFNDDRGNVFLDYIELALQLRPKFIVIENVRGLLSCPLDHRPHDQRGSEFPDLTADELKGGALNFILSKLRNSGYGYSFNLYNSANFGTPQIRERVIIVCARDGQAPPFLTPTHSENGEYGLLRWRTFRQATAGLTDHQHLTFPEKRLKYYRMLKPGQNWRALPRELQREALGNSFYAGGGKTGFLRRLDWDKPAPTLVTHPAMPATDLAHPEEDRPLSLQEYKRLQEFPDDWQLAGPMIQQYKQIGNAVPCSLGQAVGRLVIELINGETPQDYPGFPYSRYKNTANTDWEREFAQALSRSVVPSPTQEELALT